MYAKTFLKGHIGTIVSANSSGETLHDKPIK